MFGNDGDEDEKELRKELESEGLTPHQIEVNMVIVKYADDNDIAHWEARYDSFPGPYWSEVITNKDELARFKRLLRENGGNMVEVANQWDN